MSQIVQEVVQKVDQLKEAICEKMDNSKALMLKSRSTS